MGSAYTRPVEDAPLTWPRNSHLAHPGSGSLRAPPASPPLGLLRAPSRTRNQSPRPGTRPPSAPPGACGPCRWSHDSPPARCAPARPPQEHREVQEKPLWMQAPAGRPDRSLNSPLAGPRRRHNCRPVACAPLPAPAGLAPGALPAGNPAPGPAPPRPARWL